MKRDKKGNVCIWNTFKTTCTSFETGIWNRWEMKITISHQIPSNSSDNSLDKLLYIWCSDHEIFNSFKEKNCFQNVDSTTNVGITFALSFCSSFFLTFPAAGLAAKDYIDHGNLVPDDVMVDLIINELHTIQNHSWLLDGMSLIELSKQGAYLHIYPNQYVEKQG